MPGLTGQLRPIRNILLKKCMALCLLSVISNSTCMKLYIDWSTTVRLMNTRKNTDSRSSVVMQELKDGQWALSLTNGKSLKVKRVKCNLVVLYIVTVLIKPHDLL